MSTVRSPQLILLMALSLVFVLACQTSTAQDTAVTSECEEYEEYAAGEAHEEDEDESYEECENDTTHTVEHASPGNSQPADPAARAHDLRDPTATPVVVVSPDGATEITVYMQSPTGDWQTGTAIVRAVGDSTEVSISLQPPQPSAQPAHIHFGSCSAPGNVSDVLQDVVGGESTTSVPFPLSRYSTGNILIMVHLSANDFGTYTACGDLPAIP